MRFLIGTRKGLFRLELRGGDWHLGEPRFLGVPVNNAIRDPRDGSIWALVGHGHWGPKVHVSRDDMKSFDEMTCPAFPEGYEVNSVSDMGEEKCPATVKALYALTPAGADGTYHCGTSPGGFFTTHDAGETWAISDTLWKRRNDDNWFEGGGGVMLHSILVDPNDNDHIHIGVSCGGVYETGDGGQSWEPRNKGVLCDFLPEKYPEVGHDPHLVRRHPQNPNLLWQQNHCGNFRTTDGGKNWDDITEGMPSRIGFGIALDEDDQNVAWTVPMHSDEQRVAPEGALLVCRTDDGGRSWQQMRNGLPQKHCYDLVYRHALDARAGTIAFGTTCGNLFVSDDRGENWRRIDAHLPPIASVVCEAV